MAENDFNYDYWLGSNGMTPPGGNLTFVFLEGEKAREKEREITRDRIREEEREKTRRENEGLRKFCNDDDSDRRNNSKPNETDIIEDWKTLFGIASILAVGLATVAGIDSLKHKIFDPAPPTQWEMGKRKVAIVAGQEVVIANAFKSISRRKLKRATIVETVQKNYPPVYFLLPPAKMLSSKYNVLACFTAPNGPKDEYQTDVATFPVLGKKSILGADIRHEIIPGQQDCESILKGETARQYGNVDVVVVPHYFQWAY